MRLILDKNYYIEHYLNKNKEVWQISKETGWSVQKIYKDLRKHAIEKKERNLKKSVRLGKQITKEYLELNYIQLKRSSYDIAYEIGIDPSSIQRKLKKFKISARDHDDRLENLTNKQFGNLIVLHQNKKFINKKFKHKRRYWKCKCLLCGKEKNIETVKLTLGLNTSCGCNERKIGKANGKWTGFEDISGQYFGSLKSGAKNRKIEFNITIKEIWELFLKQERKCKFTGLILTMEPNRYSKKKQTASLDRINSLKGYTIDNVQWVHKDINKMKGNFTDDKFLNLCKMVSNYAK